MEDASELGAAAQPPNISCPAVNSSKDGQPPFALLSRRLLLRQSRNSRHCVAGCVRACVCQETEMLQGVVKGGRREKRPSTAAPTQASPLWSCHLVLSSATPVPRVHCWPPEKGTGRLGIVVHSSRADSHLVLQALLGGPSVFGWFQLQEMEDPHPEQSQVPGGVSHKPSRQPGAWSLAMCKPPPPNS